MRKIKQVLFEYLFLLVLLLLALPSILDAQQGAPPFIVPDPSTFSLDSLADPTMPLESEYRAPEVYIKWARAVAACEGLPFPERKFRQVQFFQVNAPYFDGAYAETYAAVYRGQVFVANPLIWNREVVSHEVLHLLLYWAGDKTWYGHDEHRFTSCGLKISGDPDPNAPNDLTPGESLR